MRYLLAERDFDEESNHAQDDTRGNSTLAADSGKTRRG
jgi:hypothetical protein